MRKPVNSKKQTEKQKTKKNEYIPLPNYRKRILKNTIHAILASIPI